MHKKEADIGKSHEFVKWFSELSNKDVQIAGGKGASLAEMYNNGFPVPPGFIVTAGAYSYFIEGSGLMDKIKLILDNLDVEDTEKLEEKTKEIRKLIEGAELPKELGESIIEAYDILDIDKQNIINQAKRGALEILKNSHENPFVAVRSSATTEDLADASFAGQQETFLNVKGEKELLQKVKECFASLFTARAVYYRAKKGFYHLESKLAVVVQRMIDSEKSGVMFSKNPASNKDEIVIEAVFGLGEGIVSGRIKPDYYLVNGEFEILKTDAAEKKVAIVRNASGMNVEVKLSQEKAKQQVLNAYEIKTLARYAKKLEEHYKKPQDIEFAIENKEIYIVQSRPITVFYKEENKKEMSGEILVSGLGASPGIGSGIIKIIRNLDELDKIQKGDVLVTEMTNPDMVVSMQKASAIVTDEGGLTSHAAIISREMGIPAVVGTLNATSVLKDGVEITVDGFNGKVFLGKGQEKLVEIKPIVQTKAKIKVILDLPDFAERAAKTGIRSVGLLRLEGIIASSGKHPLYYVQNKNIDEYTDILFNGIRKIALHFKEIWIRTSDLRSDEFGNLLGSPKEKEGNPMLGNHGIRFSLKHKEIIEAELEAVKKIALEFKDNIFGVMIPQVINLGELEETKKTALDLKMPDNVKIGIMIETPAAVQIINQLCEEGIDFVSFGTNDLTQYMLALDRNNPEIQELYDEMNPAVLSALSYVIRRCRKYGVETSICGQAGSRPEMVKFLVREGIDSISVNADAAEKVSKIVAEIESISDNISNNDEGKARETERAERVNEDLIKDKNVIDNDKKIIKINTEKASLDKDIEEIVLAELNEDDEDYTPGIEDNKKDIPPLNDAIPVDSEMFNQK